MAEGIKRPIRKGHNILIEEHCIKYLNSRIQQEELSSRIYLAMSLWLSNEGYLGPGLYGENIQMKKWDMLTGPVNI